MAAVTRRPGRPKGVQEDPQVRLDRLVDAAHEAIRTHGPDVSMDQVARAAGVSRSTLYDNFENRTALAGAVIERFGQPLLQDLMAAMAAPMTPEAVVRTGIGIYLDHIAADPAVYRFVIRNVADDTLFRGVSAVFGALVSTAMRGDDPGSEVAESLGSAALGAIVSATERWSGRAAAPRGPFEQSLGDFVWGGLVAGGMTPSADPIDLSAALAHLA